MALAGTEHRDMHIVDPDRRVALVREYTHDVTDLRSAQCRRGVELRAPVADGTLLFVRLVTKFCGDVRDECARAA